MNWIHCDLNCCFRMFRHPERPDFLSETFLGEPEDASEYAVCTATKEEWLAETGDPGEDDGYYIGDGGVPYDCPIFQGMISVPWVYEHPIETFAGEVEWMLLSAE